MAKRSANHDLWTDAEIEFLRRNYGHCRQSKIAIRLDRPEDSVYKKIKYWALRVQRIG